jgi:hypothetical protein
MLLLSLVSCKHRPPEPSAPDPYAAAVQDAARPEADELHPLLVLGPDTPGLRWDDRQRVLVTTWTRAQYFPDPPYAPGHVFPLYGETWFTAGDEVQTACAGLAGAPLAARLEQLLGLPPEGGRDVFLQVWIEPALLFRPCVDREVQSPSCSLAYPVSTADDAGLHCAPEASEHERWLCQTWTARFGPPDPAARFPWTALGYTYDWGSGDWGSGDEYGATEFVAPQGAEVVLHALVPNDELCQAPTARPPPPAAPAP